jgi:putative inorganic carbon (HCO3(-)) transporter
VPIELHRHNFWLPAALFLLATPFLLFPTFSAIGTLLALTAVLLFFLITRPPAVTPLHLPLILFSLMMLIGILVTADPELTLPKATGLILGLTSLYGLLTAVHSRRQLKLSLLCFLLLALGFTALGALSTHWVFKVPFLEQIVQRLPTALVALPESPESGVQANQLAGTILMFWPLLLCLAVGWLLPGGWKTAVRLLALLLTVLLILTQSRSGWLGGLGGLVCLLAWWGWLHLPRSRHWLIWLGFGLLGIVVVAAVMVIGPERLQQLWVEPAQETVLGHLSSVGFRQEVWRWAVEAVGDFPFTGTGLGTFRRVAQRLYPLNVPFTYDISHAHNIFGQVALDLGLPGLVAYVAMLLLAGVMGWQVARRDEELRPLAIGLVTGLIALHLYGLTDALALGSKTSLLFWLILGNLTAMKKVSGVEVSTVKFGE